MNNKFKNKTDILNHIYDGNYNPEFLVENVQLVMLSESDTITNSLVGIVKSSDLDKETLMEMLYTVDSFIQKAILIEAPLTESVQRNWVNIRVALENKFEEQSSMKLIADKEFIQSCIGRNLSSGTGTNNTDIGAIMCNDLQETEKFLEYLENLELKDSMISFQTLHDILSLMMNQKEGTFANTEIFKNLITSKVKDTLSHCKDSDEFDETLFIRAIKCLKNILQYRHCAEEDNKQLCESIFDGIDSVIQEFSIVQEGTMPMLENMNIGSLHNMNALTPMDSSVAKVHTLVSDIACAESEEEITEALSEMARLITLYETYGDELTSVTEAGTVAKKVRSVARKTEKGVSKLQKLKKSKDEVKTASKKVTDPIAAFIDKTVKDVKDADSAERRRQILNKGTYSKILRYIRRYIEVAGAGFVFGPTAAGIVLIGRMATDKHLDKKERSKILADLEVELRITREKIEDSKGDDNKKAKYELMRIEDSLVKEIDKIKYNLKY